MSANKAAAIKFAIIPRAGRLPSDIEALSVLATLTSNPAKNTEQYERECYISGLIESALKGN